MLRVRAYILTYIHKYIHKYIHAYISTYVQTYIHTNSDMSVFRGVQRKAVETVEITGGLIR